METQEFDFLVGQAVEQIWIWGAIRLVFDIGDGPEPAAYVDLEGDSRLDIDGTETALDAWGRPLESGRVVGLLHKRVRQAHTINGVLHLEFEGRHALRALPSEEYESWTVYANGQTFQCLPGGEVGSW